MRFFNIINSDKCYRLIVIDPTAPKVCRLGFGLVGSQRVTSYASHSSRTFSKRKLDSKEACNNTGIFVPLVINISDQQLYRKCTNKFKKRRSNHHHQSKRLFSEEIWWLLNFHQADSQIFSEWIEFTEFCFYRILPIINRKSN